MRIAMIGSGYVGLVSGACFAQFGHDVVCVDKDEGKIARLRKGEMPIYEPGLDKLVTDNMRAGRLSFGTGLGDAVAGADAVFIAVGTPTRRGDGHADLSYVYAAAAEIADALQGYTVVITKSTVPVGTGREVARIIREARPSAGFDVCSNPEFLREGAAIEDFMKPDRVVIGVESRRARDVMAAVYRPLNLIQTPMVFTNMETAEVTKYAGNAFLATKITFINEIADLCEKVGADVHDVARGIGLDGRIGRKFLHPGPGYGGAWLSKDTPALVRTAPEGGAPLEIIESGVAASKDRQKHMGKRSIAIIPVLQEAGARVKAFDREGMDEARQHLPDVTMCDDAYAAMKDSDAVAIVTEWNEFRALDLERMKSLLRAPVVVDLRNIYAPSEMIAAGFRYSCVGRPVTAGPAGND